MKYALIQAGITCYGVGDSERSARIEAREWLEEPSHADTAPVVEYLGDFKEAESHSTLIVVQCSDEYANAVESGNPETVYSWRNGYIDIPND